LSKYFTELNNAQFDDMLGHARAPDSSLKQANLRSLLSTAMVGSWNGFELDLHFTIGLTKLLITKLNEYNKNLSDIHPFKMCIPLLRSINTKLCHVYIFTLHWNAKQKS